MSERQSKPMTATKAIAAITRLHERRAAAVQAAATKAGERFDAKERAILDQVPEADRPRVAAFFDYGAE